MDKVTYQTSDGAIYKTEVAAIKDGHTEATMIVVSGTHTSRTPVDLTTGKATNDTRS